MKILLCTAVLFAFWSTGLAQDKLIDQATFDAVYQKGAVAGDKLKALSFRWTTTTNVKMEGRPEMDHTMKMVNEKDLAGSSHSVMESTTGTKSSRSESFGVGDTMYSRIGDGEWTQKPRESKQNIAPPPPVQESPFEITEQNVEYKQGTEVYNGRTVQTYLKTENKKGVVKRNGQAHASHQTIKHWVNDQGIIIKSEYRMWSKSGEQVQTSTIFNDWDLDAEIHITAPH